jgi:TonB-linked SusC/RagA family outer membrane protein
MDFVTKSLLAMRLTAILLLAGLLQVQARGLAQSVTYSGRGVPLTRVFAEIKRQTGFLFFYSPDDLKDSRPVTCDWKDLPLASALENLFAAQPLSYEIQGNTIVVSRAERTPVPSASAWALNGNNDIHGRVTDSLGNPLAGASVTVKGSKKGVETDGKGEFEIKGISEDAVLLITYTGYEPETVKLGGRSSVALVMRHNNDPLDQAQVIAYGTTTQRLSTGNTTTVTSKEIEQQPVDNPLLALEGRVPGLFVTQGSGIPGAGITVRIQGQNSISNGNDPFYVIDGVPYVSEFPATQNDAILGGGGVNGNPLSYINPDDIESISVLKDADATAIYGSRAANGAILITTKKGKAGQTKIDVNLLQGWGKVTRKLDMLNTQQYLQMRHEALNNDGFSPSLANGDYDLLLWDTTRYTNWQKTLIGGTAQYSNMNASVSGGSANVQYLVGGAYHRETTVFPGDFADQKGSVHFNINSVSANQKFHVQFSGIYMLDDNKLPSKDLTQSAIQLEPDAPNLYNGDGTLNWEPNAAGTSTWNNPLSNSYNVYNNKTTNLVGNTFVSYRIMPGLDIKSSFGYTDMQTSDFAGYPLIAIPPEERVYSQRSAVYGSRSLTGWSIEPQVNYKKTLEDGKIDILLGSTFLQNNIQAVDVQGTGYNSDQVLQNIAAASSINSYYSYITVYKYNAFFGRVNYNWRDKYILNLTARKDGSSRFGPEEQFHNFGSVGAAWIFSEEGLIKRLGFISFGKLRGSYGTTGNDQIGDYGFLSLYNIVPNQGIAYQGGTGLAPANLPNPYLEWEETRKISVGGDLGFLKDRMLFNLTYGRNRSSNQLLPYTLPSITGFQSITENFPATVQNASWEFSLNTINVKGRSITWKSSVNLTIPRNKLVAFPNLASSNYASNLVIGQPVTVQKVYHFLGVDPATGVYQFASKSGPTSSPVYGTDNTVLINTLPKFYGGFQNSFNYHGFELDILLQFVKQIGPVDYYNNGSVLGPGPFYSGYSNQPVTVLDRWQKPGDIAPIAKYSSQLFGSSNYYGEITNVQTSDANYRDASYVRVKNLSLSWQLPASWSRGAHFQNAGVFVQGQNLWTITKYKGMDPENQSVTSLPPLRVLTLGVRIGL